MVRNQAEQLEKHRYSLGVKTTGHRLEITYALLLSLRHKKTLIRWCEMFITWQTIITAAAVVSALTVIITLFVKVVRFIDRQKKQDTELSDLRSLHNADMASMKKEQTLLVYGILACLKGLKEQGCNGPVTEAINKIEKHLNENAHK